MSSVFLDLFMTYAALVPVYLRTENCDGSEHVLSTDDELSGGGLRNEDDAEEAEMKRMQR